MRTPDCIDVRHLFRELFRSLTKVDMLHVPYRGGGPAVTDLLAGQVQLYFSTMASSIEYIRADKLRALAVTGATRWEGLPNVPAIAEFVPNYDATAWWGIGAPKDTPVEIIQKLNTEINAGLADPKLKERFADLGSTCSSIHPSGSESSLSTSPKNGVRSSAPPTSRRSKGGPWPTFHNVPICERRIASMSGSGH
jgi:tripartite-type tricarboxylate transporter receptor subunit TctC